MESECVRVICSEHALVAAHPSEHSIWWRQCSAGYSSPSSTPTSPDLGPSQYLFGDNSALNKLLKCCGENDVVDNGDATLRASLSRTFDVVNQCLEFAVTLVVEVLLYIHRNRRLIRDGEPRTSTSTFTQLLSSEVTLVHRRAVSGSWCTARVVGRYCYPAVGYRGCRNQGRLCGESKAVMGSFVKVCTRPECSLTCFVCCRELYLSITKKKEEKFLVFPLPSRSFLVFPILFHHRKACNEP